MLTLFIHLASCDKNPQSNPPVVLPVKTKASLLIGNEGQFQHGDASLTFIDITGNTTTQDAFQVSNGRPLGDVLQSIKWVKNYYYLVVNNSQKIEIIDKDNLKSVATISGFTSPRYIEFVDDYKAYVSEFFSNQLSIINPQTHQITGKIDCGGWQEEIRIVNNQLFVTDYKKNRILVIDVNSDQIIDSVVVGESPVSLAADNADQVWVGCNGNASVKPSIYCISASTHQVVKNIQMTTSSLRKILINNTFNQVFALSDDVYSMQTSDSIPVAVKLIPAMGSGHVFYGFGIDPKTNDLYLSDAKDFQQKSTVYHYTHTGQLIGAFLTGINTGSFCFKYE